MPKPIEPATPYEQSILWRIHDAYFARRGAAAWAEGDIPFKATSNYGIARQVALFVVRAVAALERDGRLAPAEPIALLEVAGGSGRFTANFFRALDEDPEVDGAHLAPRLRYLFSDYSARVVSEAAAGLLAPLVAAGRVVPRLYDMRRPEALLAVDGTPVDEGPPWAVLANYACCVLPHTGLQKRADGWRRLMVAVTAADGPDGQPAPDREQLLARADRPGLLSSLVADYRWDPVDLDRLFADPVHARVIGECVRGMTAASLAYPHGFLDFVLRVAPRLHREGLVLVNDFGTPDRYLLWGAREVAPAVYGNSLNHQVSFALFHALAAVVPEIGVAATDDPLRSTHTVALRHGALCPPLRDAFHAALVARQDGEDMLDFESTAHALSACRLHGRAAKFYARLIEIDPGDPRWYHEMGVACLLAEMWPLALRYLAEGRDRDRDQEHDFDLPLGKTYSLVGDPRTASECYRRSLARAPSPIAHTALASELSALGDREGAIRALEAALALDPEHQPARRQLDALRATGEPPAAGAGADEPGGGAGPPPGA